MTTGLYRNIDIDINERLRSALNPLCGLVQQIGFIYRDSADPKILVAGADLCGVHVTQNRPAPKRGAYHIGGAGIYADEVIIKCIAESLERYVHFLPEYPQAQTDWLSYQALKEKEAPVIDAQYLQFFSKEKTADESFPFQKFEASKPMTWVCTQSLLDKEHSIYIPLQLMAVGYPVKKSEGEPWLLPAVTTGTAVHVTTEQAIRNALLELIQVDAVMGHWYTQSSCYEILQDARTRPLQKLLKKYTPYGMKAPRFFWIRSADLSGFVIACILQGASKPRFAIGLGADTDLLSAMYSAFLEAAGVLQLAKINLFTSSAPHSAKYENKSAIYNLDDNVVLYAQQDYSNNIKDKFLQAKCIFASHLPDDLQGNTREQVDILLADFKKTNKDIYTLEVACPEAIDLGLQVCRLWSPQLLSLVIPGAVPDMHSRFNDYGGLSHEDPHPYP